MAKPLLLVFWGESNSGGVGLNSDAPSGQLGSRANVKILNNTTLASLDVLHISNNTHVGHVGLETLVPEGIHGWELQLANRVDAGAFGSRAVRLVKAAQGGSVVFHWNSTVPNYSANGNTVNVWQQFIDKVDAAKALLAAEFGMQPEVVFFGSLGINDALTAYSPSAWKVLMVALLDRIRTRYPNCPIIITRFDSMTGTDMTGYNAAITEIGNEEQNVDMISSAGAGMRDANHWNHAGNGLVADRLIDKYLSYTVTGNPIKVIGRRVKLI